MVKNIFKSAAMMLVAILMAVNYAVFVFPNRFAPAGIDGICTIIQDLLNINIGYLALIVNIPLVIAAFFILDKWFAVKSLIYTISFSVAAILLKYIDISRFYYLTETGTSIILAPLAAGAVRGILYAVTLSLDGSSGGIDIIAALVKKKKPHFEFMNIIFVFNSAIALSSYFVYDMKIEPVICSIIYYLVITAVGNYFRSVGKETVKFEIITPDAQELCAEIAGSLHETATIVDAKGAYSGSETKMVICVVKKEKAPFVENLILKHTNCVVFKSSVTNQITGAVYK